MVQEWVDINNNNHKQKTDEQEALTEKINEQMFKKKSKIEKLTPILKILIKNLKKKNENRSNLNNMNLVFKPGLILDSILKGKSLILKYLSNLPTVVLERFNELFSGKHNLTLNEDIHDTFTEGNKEISDLGENFRIFATCSLGEQNKLSEAVLSRFTVICADKYQMEEQKNVLKSFLANNELEFDQSCIDEVMNFAQNQRNFSLSQMINALSLSNQKEIFKNSPSETRVNILSFILYRITYGLNYKYYKNPDSPLFEIEEKLKSDLPRFKGEIIKGDNDGPLINKKVGGKEVIESKYNKLQIKCVKGIPLKNDSLNNLVFTKTFSEMVDYIHLGIATNTPVILEGGTGLGKQTAINYVAHKINFKIINFIITQSTKIEDLLGRNQIFQENGNINVKFCETKILKALIGEYEGKEGENIIIVFHNLNKASSALMESLCSIFDKKQQNILRPDGLSVVKKRVNLIGIVNSQSNIALKDKLPLSLINCVFYYILPKLLPKEIEEIIKKKFTAYKLESEASDFADCFNKSRQFSNNKGNISYFSLNDITKYILFRRHSKNSIDKSIILQIIFAYRFIQNEFIKDIMKELGFLSMKVNPIIKNKDKYLSISFKNKDIKDEIKLPYINNFEIDKKIVEEKINTLNLKQKQCMLFLVLSVLCKRACIIQGDTASGKTHLVRLFAEMVGQKLIVYQINKETGLSIFTGQSTLQDHLENDEINTILNYFQTLSKKEELKGYLNNYFFYDNYDNDIIKKKWTVKNFNDLIRKIRDYYEKDTANLQNEEYKEYEDIANNLEDLIQPHKRFKKKESTFINALKNGYWVLIDGIESSNPVISDKLIRLCDENSELDLTETGENIIFSKNSSDINKIHDNFHLFINYNPLNKSNNNQLNEMFLNKCLTFTLEPMDVDVESSAQIVYGFMKNTNKINEILCQEISSKVALIHQAMNKKILQNQEFFSGGIEFTGRIIKYISEEISKSENNDDLCKHLVNAFYLNYINSINNKNDIKNIIEVKNIINAIIKKGSIRFDTGEKDIYLKYSEIFKVLRNIQKVSKNTLSEFDFNFLGFLKSLKRVEISDLSLIYHHIDETLSLLDAFVGNSIDKKIKYFHYYNLQIIKKLLKNLLNYVDKNNKYNLMDFTLNDKNEFFNKSILIEEISKFDLVERLETEISKIKLTDSFICIPNQFIEYLDSTKKLLETNDIKDLFKNLKIVENCVNQGINITQLFPFNLILLDELEKKENSGKTIRMYKIIFLIYKIIENKVNFQFDYDSNVIIFDYKNDDDDLPFKNLYIKIGLTKDFYCINTNIINKIVLEEKKILVITDSFEDEEEQIDVTNWFYIICNKILDNKIQINDKKQMRDILDDISEKKIRILDELNEEFRSEIKDGKRTYSITKLLSKPNDNLDTKEEILIMKLWYLMLFYEEETLSSITPFFSLSYEKELLEGVKNMYEHIKPKLLNEYISLTKNLLKELKIGNSSLYYGSSNTFLYKIQAGFFHYSYVEDRDKKDYYTQIEKEINFYKTFNSLPLEEYWSNSKSINCLRNQFSNLKEYVENSNLTEKYRNKLNELISNLKTSNLEGKEGYKGKLIQLLENKLDNPTKEIYEKCRENVENFLNNLKENVSENQIIFPPIKPKNEYGYNKDHKYVFCLNLLKNYSIYHKKLTNIFQSSKNITDIYGLDREIEIVIDILGQYVIENGDYIRMHEEKVMGIIRALIICNIINYGKTRDKIEELFDIFIKLSRLINEQTGGTGFKLFNESILTWTKSDKTNLEDYFLIPKFEPKDFQYLFLITYTEEKENKKLSKPGFLFKNLRNKNLLSILSNSLEDLGEGERNQFENYVGKIGRSLLKNIFRDKWDNEFKELSNNELLETLNKEEQILKYQIEENKRNNNPSEKEEMHKDIIMAIINCFNLATFYEHNYSVENKLTYEDIEFFKSKNWKNELISKYPGMSYWLSKNHSFYLELMNKKDLNGCFIAEDNKISFWYFQIRVFSNIKTFEFDCYEQKNIEIKNKTYNIGKELNENEINPPKKEIEKFIIDNISSLIRDKKPVNINWINLVLNDIPPELKITNKNLRHFYEFFANLIADSINDIQKTTKNMIISEYIIKLLDLIFKNKIEEIFNKNIYSNDDELILLINKPQDEIIKKIKERNQKKKKETEIKVNIRNTSEYLTEIINKLPEIIDKINKIVKKKTKDYQNNFKSEKENRLKLEEKNIMENFNSKKDSIKKCLDIIENKDLQDQKKLEESINELNNLWKFKNYFNFSPQKRTICYKLTINTLLRNDCKYVIKIKKKDKNEHKNARIEFDNNNKYIYLQTSVFDWEDIQNLLIFASGNNKDFKKLNIIKDIKTDYLEIDSFDSNMSFNEELKEKMLHDAESSMEIYETKITFNGEEFKKKTLDDFMESLKKFDIKIIEEVEKYDENRKRSIWKIINSIIAILEYLNVRTSQGGYNDPSLENSVRSFRDCINHFKKLLEINLNDVQGIIESNKKIEGNKIFKEKHDIQIKFHEEPQKAQPIHIYKIEYLNYPMISDNEKSITFSSKSFHMFLGSYIPSILSSPLIIKLLNLKENKIKGRIKDSNKDIVTVEDIDNENFLKIHINIQNLKSDKFTKENIKFNLEINSESYSSITIPFNLDLNIVPLSILFSSPDYKLNYDSNNNVFNFCSSKVYSNSKIQFVFKYLYESKYPNQLNDNIVYYDYSLESLEDNNSKKPELEQEKNKIIVKMPKYEIDKNNIINFILKVYFSSTFYINIKFNCTIYNFDFSFKWYSYNKKEFINEDIVFYIDDIAYEYILYLKVEKMVSNTVIEYEMDYRLPKELIEEKIITTNFQEEKKKKEFIFYIKLRIKNNKSTVFRDKYISIKANGVEKKLFIKAKNINKVTNLIDDLFDLPKYKYIDSINNCIEENEIDKRSIYITPFNYYLPCANNLYNSKYFNPKFDPKFKLSLICVSKKKWNFSKIDYIGDKYRYEEFIKILGIFDEDKWYPIIEMEGYNRDNDIFKEFKYYEYEVENIAKAEYKIKRINDRNDYWLLPRLFQYYNEKRRKDYLLDFIKLLPESIKIELKNEKELLESEEVYEFLPIITNNMIYILYHLFNTKYSEIISNDDTLNLRDKDLPLNSIEFVKKKRKEYFQRDEKQFSLFKNESMMKGIENDNEFDGNNNFLLNENKNPEIIDRLNQIFLDEEKIEMKKTKSEKFDLSNISLPDFNRPTTNYSINKIIDYYNHCNKIANILYFYIISASKSDNKEGEKKAGNYFAKLKSIFAKYTQKDFSFFSICINDYLKSFKNLNQKLQEIGYEIGKLKRNVNKDYNKSEESYIIFPNIKGISKDNDYWQTEKNEINNQFRPEEIQTGRLTAKFYNNEEYLSDNNDSDVENENGNNIDNEIYKSINKDYKMENIKIIDIDDGRDNINEEDKEDLNEDDIKFKNLPEKKVKIGKITDKLITIDEPLNEEKFREEDGIERALKDLEEEKKKKDSNLEQILDLGNPRKSHKFSNYNDFNLNRKVKLPIQDLYNKSSSLANQLFIRINGNGKVKFFDTQVIILLDPSVYISQEIKIINMFIVCAMTNALNCLEINYSIVLMGDEDFRCVLKDYNEPHSVEALERVYECLMLGRFRTNIPACLKYSLQEVRSKSLFKNTSFFVFTDGLDKRFIYTQRNTWASNIFNNKANSFAFIFLLSSVLTNGNKEFLNGIWDTFVNESKRNSPSNIFIKSLELRINEDFKNKIIEIFSLNLIRSKNEEQLNEIQYKKPIFEIKNEISVSNILNTCDRIFNNKSLSQLNSSYIKNEKISSSLNTNKEPLDTNLYKNNLHQIAKKVNNKVNEQENNIVNFAHKFLNIRANLNRGILEEIFKPNKANLKVLSNVGTEIDIMALILYFLNPVPDPMIYLQDAIGNSKEYAITIILDTSFSVLNHMNIIHSLNTIRVLLASLTIIDLPSLDLIVTGEDGPIILCSEYPTFAALNEKSKLWELLCHCLSNPIKNADLLSALQTAFDLKRMRTNNFPSFLFVLTDGLFEEEKQNQLKEIVGKLVQNNIQVIGIGLGIYPNGIKNIFGQAIFDMNPNNLLHSILSILEGNVDDRKEMNYIQNEDKDGETNINSIKAKLINNNIFLYKSLREDLRHSPLTINCYDMMNEEISGGFDELRRPINPYGDNIGLFKKNSLAGQKILIVMLWSCQLSITENKLLDPKNIVETNESDKSNANAKSIKTIVEHLGIKVKTVLNYEDAIKEITDKDENGKCNYYTVWVMCGPGIDKLPDKSRYPGLVEQFIDCLLLYWNNGGGVILFCDNDPLYFQANMFLEKIRFKGEIKETKLRITGNDEGTKMLRAVKANGNLTVNSIYDDTIIKLPNNTERLRIGFNVPNIYEGETISHANSNNNDDIKPFIPFAKNSSGNICMMIYGTQGKEGDIIIDCGYTKVFTNMGKDDSGTWRYIENIACFLARPEAHMIYDDNITAKNYRPNGVDFVINYKNLYRNLSSFIDKLDIVYMIDSTGSMESWIKGVKDKCKEILIKLNENETLKTFDIKFGGIFYRDPVDKEEDIHEYQPLGDVDNLKTKMESISAKGGGDTPEDWVGAYEIALNNINMKWRHNSIKIIIHIADAGAHTLRFSDGDEKHNKPEYENALVNLIKKCARKHINIFGYQIDDEPKKSFLECQAIYNSVNPVKSYYEIYKFEHLSDEKVAQKLKDNIIEHISAFISKI